MSEITKQDALRWLEMQRDAVNTEIVYAPQSEKKQYHKHLEIINALAERVQEMTAVEYLEAREKMPMIEATKSIFAVGKDNRRAVEIVKRWKEEQDAPRP